MEGDIMSLTLRMTSKNTADIYLGEEKVCTIYTDRKILIPEHLRKLQLASIISNEYVSNLEEAEEKLEKLYGLNMDSHILLIYTFGINRVSNLNPIINNIGYGAKKSLESLNKDYERFLIDEFISTSENVQLKTLRELGVPRWDTFRRRGIQTVGDVLKYNSLEEMKEEIRLICIGPKTLGELRKKLKELGIEK